VLRGIFGWMRKGVIADWGKMHNEKLYDLYSSSKMIKSRMRWGEILWILAIMILHKIFIISKSD
jgi:hypothetical protein